MLLLTTYYVTPLLFFFFTDPPSTEIYTLSLHDALPICGRWRNHRGQAAGRSARGLGRCCRFVYLRHRFFFSDAHSTNAQDRKSTRLNSSHVSISYAVFCLKKKNPRHHDRRVDLGSVLPG